MCRIHSRGAKKYLRKRWKSNPCKRHNQSKHAHITVLSVDSHCSSQVNMWKSTCLTREIFPFNFLYLVMQLNTKTHIRIQYGLTQFFILSLSVDAICLISQRQHRKEIKKQTMTLLYNVAHCAPHEMHTINTTRLKKQK